MSETASKDQLTSSLCIFLAGVTETKIDINMMFQNLSLVKTLCLWAGYREEDCPPLDGPNWMGQSALR